MSHKPCYNKRRDLDARIEHARFIATMLLRDVAAGDSNLLTTRIRAEDIIKALDTPARGPHGPAKRPLSASEALYAFGGWLTTRRAVSGPFGAHHLASGMAELISAFCRSQRLDAPRPAWDKQVRPYPDR